MSKVDMILNAASRREKAKRTVPQTKPESSSFRPEDVIRLAALGLCMFVAGLVILSQPPFVDWLNSTAQTAEAQNPSAFN